MLAYNQGKFSDPIIFYISGFHGYLFWSKHSKFLMGSKRQIFVRLRITMTIFSDLKRIMMVKEIPRNGVMWCIEIAPNDL